MSQSRTRARLSLLGLLHALAGALIASTDGLAIHNVYGERTYDAAVIFVLGTCFAQTTLCTCWGSLGRSHFSWRWPGSAFLVIVCSLAVNLFYRGIVGLLLFPTVMLIQWLAIQVPCWILRLKYGWRVAPAGVDQRAPGQYETQFGIKHLLVWTTGVAVLCAVMRGLSSVASWGVYTRDIGILSLLGAFNTLLSIPPLWATLSHHAAARWVAVTIAYGLALGGLEHVAFSTLLARGDLKWYFFLALNLVQLVWLLGSLWLVRWAGYRLVRSGGLASSVAT